MKQTGDRGLTLIEMLLAISIMGIIASATTALFSVYLQAHAYGTAKSQLYTEGLLAMERMTSGVRRCTFLLIPNNHNKDRDILVFSGFVNDDDDYYFDDPLFPRIDEDATSDMNDDDRPGLKDVDDDGDSLTDETLGGDEDVPGLVFEDIANDDEDSEYNEDPLDGIDNDGDGNVDEDTSGDMYMDNAPGIKGMDDDGDGQVDEVLGENAIFNDDEDDTLDEVGLIPVIFSYDSGNNTLEESIPYTGESAILSTHVTDFKVRYDAPEKIGIWLTLTSDDGEKVEFFEYVYPRNTFQKTGKRVR